MLVVRLVSFLTAFLSVAILCAQSQDEARTLVAHYCAACHQGKSPAGGLNLTTLAANKSPADAPQVWDKILSRVRNSEMPPKGVPGPDFDEREKFIAWIDNALKTAACANGIKPGPYPLRRLNRDEYGATIRDLLHVHVNAAHALPSDGAGGEGFDNAAETLFVSPIHAEKYLAAAKEALEYAAKDPKSREVFLIAEPDASHPPEETATKILIGISSAGVPAPGAARRGGPLHGILSRRPETRGEFRSLNAVRAWKRCWSRPISCSVSKHPIPIAEPRLVDDYALANRLSYFLWGSMPDAALFDLAAQGKLHDPDVLKSQVVRHAVEHQVARLRRAVRRAVAGHARAGARYQAGPEAVSRVLRRGARRAESATSRSCFSRRS